MLDRISQLGQAAVLIGASLLAGQGCGSKTQLNEPDACFNSTPEAGLCCESNELPDVNAMADEAAKKHTSKQLCEIVADNSRAVLCLLDRDWDQFLYPYAKTTYDGHGDPIFISDAWGTSDLPGEMICNVSSYKTESGETRENVECDYWDGKTGNELFFASWQTKDYPTATDVYSFVRIPEKEGDIIDFSFFTDTVGDTPYKANTPYVWMEGVYPNAVQEAECPPPYMEEMTQYSSHISAIAHRVVGPQ